MYILHTDSAGLIQDVPVSWLMENLMVSVDGFTLFECGEHGTTYCYCDETCPPTGIDWDMLTEDKSQDDCYSRLLDSIRAKGFIVPICVHLPYWGDPTLGLGNGHHRMTAAINEGIESIPVYWTASHEYMATTHTAPEGLDW